MARNATENEDVEPKLRKLFMRANISTARDDIDSHYILRLAQCETDAMRTVFRRLESLLFKVKCKYFAKQTLQAYLQNSGVVFDKFNLDDPSHPIPPLVRSYLESLALKYTPNVAVYRLVFGPSTYDLVHRRERVVVSQGYVYLRHEDIADVIVAKFDTDLSRGLSSLWRERRDLSLPEVDAMLHALQAEDSSQYNPSQVMGAITKEQIPLLSEVSFPPCMTRLYDSGKRDSHLRHMGRLQFGLFLKGCGLSMDAALAFWRELFSKKFTAERFDKDYAYNIRHVYGAEGKRQETSGFGCAKIIQSAVGQGEYHGCPFRHERSKDRLAAIVEKRLRKVDAPLLGGTATAEIVDLAVQGHAQLACACLFKRSHGGTELEVGVRHPNEYFDKSRAYWEKLAENATKEQAPAQTPAQATPAKVAQ
jgi:DNA primase large subunit